MKKLAILLVLIGSPAWAGDALEKGEGMFARMEYAEAQQLAESVLSSADADLPDLVRAYRLKGLCQAALNQGREAVKTFRNLLSIKPAFRLAKGLSPKYTAPFYQAVALSEETGYLELKNRSPEVRKPDQEPRLKLELVSDPLQMVAAVRLNYWTGQRDPLRIRRQVKGPGVTELPLQFTRRSGEIQYYFEALNQSGGVVARLGSRENPFRLRTRARPTLATSVAVPPAVPPPDEPPPEPAEDTGNGDRWYTSWWFWTIVGVVAAGTATGITLAVMGDSADTNDYQVTWEY